MPITQQDKQQLDQMFSDWHEKYGGCKELSRAMPRTVKNADTRSRHLSCSLCSYPCILPYLPRAVRLARLGAPWTS